MREKAQAKQVEENLLIISKHNSKKTFEAIASIKGLFLFINHKL